MPATTPHPPHAADPALAGPSAADPALAAPSAADPALAGPGRDQIELEAVLHALSDPTRLHIVRALADHPDRPCGGFDCRVSKSTLTHHFKVLRSAGVIALRQRGTMRLSSLRREDLDARFPGLLDTILRAKARADAPRP